MLPPKPQHRSGRSVLLRFPAWPFSTKASATASITEFLWRKRKNTCDRMAYAGVPLSIDISERLPDQTSHPTSLACCVPRQLPVEVENVKVHSGSILLFIYCVHSCP